MKNNEAIFWARKVIKESVYNLSQFENLNLNFPETETIIDGEKIEGLNDYEINVILNLKRAWLSILNNPKKTIKIEELKKLSQIIGEKLILEEGNFWTRPNHIEGYQEEIPALSLSEIQTKIRQINEIANPIDRVCEWIAWAIPSQLFWDANKRTAFLMANSILIAENVGVLSIKQTDLLEFNLALHHYYNQRTETKKKDFIQILKQNIQLTDSFEKKNSFKTK